MAAALARAATVREAAAGVTRAAPVDPLVRQALAEVAAEAVSAAERAVGERVARGRLGWDDVWRDPHALGPGGVRLVQRALVRLSRQVAREVGGPALGR